MAESTLTYSYDDLALRVGEYLGLTPDSSVWDTAQTAQIDRAIQRGYALFLRNNGTYRWTFLRPTITVNLVADTTSYTLDDEVVNVEDRAFITSEQKAYTIRLVKLSDVRRDLAYFDRTGPPELVALDRLPPTTTEADRTILRVAPKPDGAYTLELQAEIKPNKLTSSTVPIPYGGTQHSETILAACLAAAEEVLNPDAPKDGPKWSDYREQLAISMRLDARNKATVVSRRQAYSEREGQYIDLVKANRQGFTE